MKKYGVWLILLIAFLCRYMAYLHSPVSDSNVLVGSIWVDEKYYYLPAMQYILDFGLPQYFCNEISVMVASGNPLYLAALYQLFGGDFQLMRQFNIFLSCVDVFLLYKLARKVFGEKAGLLAAAGLAFNPLFIPYAYVFMTEVLFVFFVLSALCLYVHLTDSEKKTDICSLLAIGILLFLATLTRSITMILPFFLLVFFMAVYLYRHQPEMKLLLRRFLIVALMFAALLCPVLWKNHVLFHTNVLSTGSGAVLWLGSKLETEGDEPPYYGIPYDPVIVGEIYAITGNLMHFTIEGDALLQKAAVAHIKENFSAYLRMDLKKIGRLTVGSNYGWFYPEGNRLAAYYEKMGLGNALEKFAGIVLYAYVYVFGLAGVYRYRHHREGQILILVILYFLLLSLPFLAILRYGLPIFMLMAIFAAAETFYLTEFSCWKRSAAAISLTAFITVFICLGF